MEPRVTLSIAGDPAPKGSRSFGANGGNWESSKRCKPWVEAVAYAALANRPGGKVLEPPYAVEVEFNMPRPKRPKYGWPVIGDIDKLERACLDGLVQGGLIADDRHVVSLRSSKRFAPGSTGVTLRVF